MQLRPLCLLWFGLFGPSVPMLLVVACAVPPCCLPAFLHARTHALAAPRIPPHRTPARPALQRDINAGRFADNTSLVLVTHGLALRIFLMRWFHWTVDQFMGVFNPVGAGLWRLKR